MHRYHERIKEKDLTPFYLAVLSGTVVFIIAYLVFPYHSSNHDEAVYLQQAGMLLDGKLQLYTSHLTDFFRPWFFIEDNGYIYPKYNPIPAVFYSVTMWLIGEPRVTLAVVAGVNTFLVYELGKMAFDERTGLAASIVFAVSPLALITSSVFLPYASVTALNLGFAVLYMKGLQKQRPGYCVLAGMLIGASFFARPFTAVLFASPFILYAVIDSLKEFRSQGSLLSENTLCQIATSLPGVSFVASALIYNRYLTGDYLLFPFEKFAPMDGVGFGERRILGHSVDYTLELALESNGYVLYYFSTRWFTAGILGVILAIIGLYFGFVQARDRYQGILRLCLLGVAFSVIAGNLAFWGNYNILADMSNPTDGLISFFGPFYHFDLLAPLSIFAGAGLVCCKTQIKKRISNQRIVYLVISLIIIVALSLNTALIASPMDRNMDYTEKYEKAYQPFEEQEMDNALVFLPTPYGDWLNHPFQYLRNNGLSGDTVYAMDHGQRNFEVIDEHLGRSLYRYSYRGEWITDPDQHVVPRLDELRVFTNQSLRVESRLGIPSSAARSVVRAENGDRSASMDIKELDEVYHLNWGLNEEYLWIEDDVEIEVNDSTPARVSVILVDSEGSTLSYEYVVDFRNRDGLEVMWPPRKYVCVLVLNCGSEGTYIDSEVRGEVYMREDVSTID